MLILGIVCLIGWIISSIWLHFKVRGNSTGDFGDMAMVAFAIFGYIVITLFWLLMFFGIGFFIK